MTDRGGPSADAAWVYKNEAEVGQGIKDAGIDRKELWVTSKREHLSADPVPSLVPLG